MHMIQTTQEALLDSYKAMFYDVTLRPRANDFSSVAQYFVQRAMLALIARIRMSDNTTPPDVIEFILAVVEHEDNSTNAYSNGRFVATLVEAVSWLRGGTPTMSSADVMARVVALVERYLLREHVLAPEHRCPLVAGFFFRFKKTILFS
jgi:hypothetical protein